MIFIPQAEAEALDRLFKEMEGTVWEHILTGKPIEVEPKGKFWYVKNTETDKQEVALKYKDEFYKPLPGMYNSKIQDSNKLDMEKYVPVRGFTSFDF